MASWILFDALLAGMLVLIVPIGFWRGGVREAVLGGSILAGAMLGNAFAVRWGPAVAELLGTRDAVGATVLAESLLWGSVVLLGYVGGATIRQAGHSLVGRIAGSIIGLFNGLLLLGFSLRFINILLLGQEPGRWMEGGYGYIAAILSRGTEELLLLAVVVLSVGVVAGLLARLFGAWESENDLLAAEAHQGSLAHAWPAAPPTPRVAYERHGGEAIKIEPDVPSRGALQDFVSPATWRERDAPAGRGERANDGYPHEPERRYGEGQGGALSGSRFRGPIRQREEPPSRPEEDPPDGASVVDEWLRRAPASNRRRNSRNGTDGSERHNSSDDE